jgi:enoyl-CoA hydratase
MSEAGEGIRVRRDGEVTAIIIDRPQARNALDTTSVLSLKTALRAFDADESARVAVL